MTIPLLSSILAAVSIVTVEVQQPPSFSVPRGAQHVPMLLLTFRADCTGDRDVDALQLLRKGQGLHTDIIAVYAESQGLRVSNAATIARDGSVRLRLKGFTVPTCDAKDLLIVADFAQDSNVAGEHRFELAGGDAVAVYGAQVRMEAAPGRTLTGVRTAGDQAGKVVVEYLRLLKNVGTGDNRIVMRLKFTVQGSADQEIMRITFTNAGSAQGSDLRNIVLHDARGGTLSGSAKELTGRRVALTLDPPLLLKHGSSKMLELHAAVRSGARKTLKFIIEEPGDIWSRERRGRGR